MEIPKDKLVLMLERMLKIRHFENRVKELFAAGAYVGAGAVHEASLTVQDVLRWMIILAIAVGAAFKFMGVF
jgi:hypothetical protein